MTTNTIDSSSKFDSSRAAEYERQSRIALAGYDACHELSACMLAAALGSGGSAHVLVAGAGGGAREVLTAGALEPGWRFTAVDPSEAMMEIAVAATEAAEFARTSMRKPVAAYIAGLSAPKGRKMGHAGAIISAFGESAPEKVEILREAGVTIAPTPAELGSTVAAMLSRGLRRAS